MKKALFITHMLNRTGAPLVLMQMMDVFSRNSYSVDVISMEDGVLREDLGIDSDIVPFAAPENEILPDSSHMWQNDKLKLIMTGQLSFLKGQDIFIDALNLLPEQMAEKMQIIMCLGANENDAEVVSKVNAASEKYHNITVIDYHSNTAVPLKNRQNIR